MSKNLLKDSGVLIVDNVLFRGHVIPEYAEKSNSNAHLFVDRFNKHIATDPRVEQVILTVRDGLSLIRKKT